MEPDLSLIKGSHGCIHVDEKYYPVLITDQTDDEEDLSAIDIHEVIRGQLFPESSELFEKDIIKIVLVNDKSLFNLNRITIILLRLNRLKYNFN